MQPGRQEVINTKLDSTEVQRAHNIWRGIYEAGRDGYLAIATMRVARSEDGTLVAIGHQKDDPRILLSLQGGRQNVPAMMSVTDVMTHPTKTGFVERNIRYELRQDGGPGMVLDLEVTTSNSRHVEAINIHDVRNLNNDDLADLQQTFETVDDLRKRALVDRQQRAAQPQYGLGRQILNMIFPHNRD